MPKFLRSLVILPSIFIGAACSHNNSSAIPSTAANPSSTLVTVTTKDGGPIDQVAVTLSTSLGANGPTGIIESNRTNSGGQVRFSDLPSSGQLCVYAASLVGGTLFKANHCAQPFPANYTLKFNSNLP
ncbi:MAG TPA: hypothetical protein VHS56_12510 [Candidatus Cybelea sp.]|jgi:tripartite-type tricarboxylate transporter receptor subunit TctC|nr:hypothetical protein [Candidatus Cybelea sp.]